MPAAHFTFLPDLNLFLTAERRSGSFEMIFESGQSVKHLVEAAGVPHTEVGQITVHHQPVDFHYQVKNEDALQVFPATATSSPPPSPVRFVLDSHLGRLSAYLRMLGFDVVYRNNFDDEELALISAMEDRILLTRDRRLLMRRAVRYGYCLRSLNSRQQALEVLHRYGLSGQIAPFQRCLRCNTPLVSISKEQVFERLQPLTRLYYEDFHICPSCGQIYWKGSHYERMQDMVEQMQQVDGASPSDREEDSDGA